MLISSIQKIKNNNKNSDGLCCATNQEKEQQHQRQTFIMFRSRDNGDYYSLKEQYHRYERQQEQLHLYHLSNRFDAETFRTRTICNLVHWIDWGTPFEILAIDEIAATIIRNKKGTARRLICKRCVLGLAHPFTEQEREEIQHIYDDDAGKVTKT
jgi:hypothetical protein